MIPSQVEPEALGPEVMVLGPPPTDHRSRRAWVVVAAVLVVLLAGYGVWRWWPQPPADFTVSDLEGTYTGMVRSDGLNELSVVTRDKLTEPPAAVSPAACVPLFDQTLSNQFPATALDGVSTYWLDSGSASISLVTYRYPDPEVARAQFDRVQQSLGDCGDQPMRVDSSNGVQASAQALPGPAQADDYLSYLVSTPLSSTRFSVDVMLFTNTVTWQYRYDYSRQGLYSSVPAQQLMASLATQMAFIQDSHQ